MERNNKIRKVKIQTNSHKYNTILDFKAGDWIVFKYNNKNCIGLILDSEIGELREICYLTHNGLLNIITEDMILDHIVIGINISKLFEKLDLKHLQAVLTTNNTLNYKQHFETSKIFKHLLN